MRKAKRTVYFLCHDLFPVVGALIGKQKGRNIEVMNSFELHFDAVDKDIIIDMEYYNTKEEQCMKLTHICLVDFSILIKCSASKISTITNLLSLYIMKKKKTKCVRFLLSFSIETSCIDQ